MSTGSEPTVGSVVALWRYPVKSMLGEELNAAEVTEGGLLGDRGYALIDVSDGKVASAKNPRKWGRLFEFRAAFVEPPYGRGKLPPVRITLPDGATLTSDREDLNPTISRVLGRQVRLATPQRGEQEVEATAPNPWKPNLEEYWPDIEGLTHRDTVTDEAMPEGTFFDLAPVHLLTSATIDRLRALYPQGRFEVRRFRPNIVVEPVAGGADFAENAWVGRTLAIGDEVRLRVVGLCPRCVMTTLPQGDLPKDPGILRTAARHNGVNVGVYIDVLQGGTIRRGDLVVLR